MAAPSVDLLGGYKIPVVGLGTWQCTDEKALEQALNAALEHGYRHIDTAFAYQNEGVIGRVLKQWLDSGRITREALFITTKLPMEAVHPDRVESFIKKSLEKLQLQYVDLYLIHFPVGSRPKVDVKEPLVTEPTDHIAIWKKMEEQVDAGRTRTIGVSNFNKNQVRRIVENSRIKPASLQIENHVLLQQEDLVQFAQANGIVVVAYSPLGSPGTGAYFARIGFSVKEKPSVLNNPVVQQIAQKHQKTPAHVALRFQLQRNIVVIPKSVTVERVKENINLFDFTLDEGDMAALRALEVGEVARVCDFSFSTVLKEHPEWPFPK